MEPTYFRFKISVIRRKVWINVVILAVAALTFVMAGPSPSVFHVLSAYILVVYLYRLIQALAILRRGSPAVTITDDGVRDFRFGDAVVPWSEVKEIKTVAAPMRMGGSVVLMVDTARLKSIPGTVTSRIANYIAGVRAGQPRKPAAVMLMPTAALDASLDEVIDAIRSRTAAAAIPVTAAR